MAGNRKPRHKRGDQSKQWRQHVKPYNGNARFIEIGAIDAPFRNLINIDHIVTVQFGQSMREVDVEIFPAILAKDADLIKGSPAVEAVPAITEKQTKQIGWQIVFVIDNGQTNSLEFAELKPAMGLYNSIVKQIGDVAVPCSILKPLAMPEAANEPVAKTNGEDTAAESDDGADYLEDLPFLTEEELHDLEYPVAEDGSPLPTGDADPDPDEPVN